MDPRIEKLAEILVDYSVGVSKGDVVMVGTDVGGAPLAALVRVVLLCYYRDDRVMRSLGQEARPPFPKGHVAEQGDWSLLDPVRARKPRYRRVE